MQFHMNFNISFSGKRAVAVLIEIVSPQIALSTTAIITMFSLAIHEHGMSIHLGL